MLDDDESRLAGLLRSPAPEEERIEALVRALDARDPELRALAVRGLARTLAETDRPPESIRAAQALRDRGVPYADRLALARVLVRLPGKAPALVAELRQAAEGDDDELRDLCRTAVDRWAGAHGGTAVDWEAWRRRAEAHDARGLFPAVWLHAGGAPAPAAAVLRAAWLGGCSGSLYAEGVSEEAILASLIERDAVDEEVAHDCLRRLQTGHLSPLALVVLRAAQPWPGLADALWTVLERHPHANPVLLREVLANAHGGDRVAGAALARRIRSLTNPGAVVPYLRFLAGNPGWEETAGVLREASRHPPCRTGIARAEWVTAWATLGKRPADPDDGAIPPGPGFADD